MAEYDDAESIMGDDERPSRGSARVSRAHGPIGKAWAWFATQPAQTKVIVIGVIVVLGVVVWMTFRKNKRVDTDDEVTTGAFNPLGQTGPGAQGPVPGQQGPTGIAIQPPSPGPTPVPTTFPGQNGPTGIANHPLGAAQTSGTQAAAYRPPVVFTITPQRAAQARQVTPWNTRPMTLTPVPTGRNVNVSLN